MPDTDAGAWRNAVTVGFLCARDASRLADRSYLCAVTYSECYATADPNQVPQWRGFTAWHDMVRAMFRLKHGLFEIAGVSAVPVFSPNESMIVVEIDCVRVLHATRHLLLHSHRLCYLSGLTRYSQDFGVYDLGCDRHERAVAVKTIMIAPV
jgi:hypothetical protein